MRLQRAVAAAKAGVIPLMCPTTVTREVDVSTAAGWRDRLATSEPTVGGGERGTAMGEVLRVILAIITAFGAYRRQREADAEQLRQGYRRDRAKIVVTSVAFLGIVLVAVALVIPIALTDWGGRNPALLTVLLVAGIVVAMFALAAWLKRWPDYRPISKERQM
jgi:hypothetical protein